MPRRALITGITGQAGPYLAEHLFEEGYEVFGLVRGHGHTRIPALRREIPALTLVSGDMLAQSSLVEAVDRVLRPHEGLISSSGRPNEQRSATWDVFHANLRRLGLLESVDLRRARSTAVEWSRPIGLLFIDGLHDAPSVRADFDHFAPWVVEGGIIAFDDYSPNFPDVMTVVDALLRESVYEKVSQAGDLLAIRKLAPARTDA